VRSSARSHCAFAQIARNASVSVSEAVECGLRCRETVKKIEAQAARQ
jgi:Zn ribbon nucleic-acid-binding protein